MDQDETWHAGRPRPRPHCVRWGRRSPSPSQLLLSSCQSYLARVRFVVTDAVRCGTVISHTGKSWRVPDIQGPAWRLTTLAQFVGRRRRRVWSTSTPLCRIEPFTDSAVQAVNHRRSSVSGRSSTVLKQSARQCHVCQFVVGFRAATEAHTVPTAIPRHYHVIFGNCNTHSSPSSGIAT